MARSGVKFTFIGAALLILACVCASWAGAGDDQICGIKADLALGREDYPAAIMLHRQLLQARPDNALVHYHLGFAYGMIGRTSDELNEYLKSVRLGLKTWDLFLNLGLAFYGQHQLAQAAEALKTAKSLAPAHPEPYFNLALVYEDQNRTNDALREILAARRLAPNDPEIANMNAIIYAESGELDRARGIWNQLVQIAPDYQPATANLLVVNRSSARNSQFTSRAELKSDAQSSLHNTAARP